MAVRSRSLSAPFGIERARAREIPPRRPPQVRARMTPLVKVLRFLSIKTGNETANILVARISGMAIIPKTRKRKSNSRARISSPIIRNKRAFRISSISSQNESTCSSVLDDIASTRP